MTNPERKPDQPEGPAIITDRFVQDRKVSKAAGAEKGYRALHPWDLALQQNRLGYGNEKYSASMRAMAWSKYHDIWVRRYPVGKDSSQGLSVSGGALEAGSLAGSQIDAMRELEALEGRGSAPYSRHLGQRDAIIVKMVCGMGGTASEGVRLVQPSYRFAVWPRFCESLDALIEAFSGGRK